MSDIIKLQSFKMLRLVLDQDPFDGRTPGSLCRQETGYDIRINKDNPDHFLMILRVKGTLSVPEGKSQPATYEVTGAAEFEVPHDMTADKKRGLVAFNGGSILYGLMRGQVALVTGSFPTGSVLLLTLNWQETVREIESKRAEARAGHLFVAEEQSTTSVKPESSSSTAAPVVEKRTPAKARKRTPRRIVARKPTQ